VRAARAARNAQKEQITVVAAPQQAEKPLQWFGDLLGAFLIIGTGAFLLGAGARGGQTLSAPTAAAADSLFGSPSSTSTSRSSSNPARANADYPYRGSSGMSYQYDLSRPQDQIRYDIDPRAQIRDSISVDPRRDLDRSMGQVGGGAKR